MAMCHVFANAAKRVFPVLIVLLLAACGAAATTSVPYTKIADAKLKPGSPIPTPTGENIITISGKIGTTNSDDVVLIDIPTLETLMQIEYKVTDPFDKVDVTYQGVLLTDLLDVLQVDKSATKLKITALDDYTIELPFETIRKWSLMLAIKANGDYLQIEKRGPAEIIFPNKNFEIDSTHDGLWIWQIKAIEVQ